MEWRRCAVIVVIAMACCLLSQAEEPLRTAADRPADILHIRLDLRVLLPEKCIAGSATIDLLPLRELCSVRLNAVDHEVGKVLDGDTKVDLAFENTGTELIIDLGGPQPIGRRRRLEIHYQVREPKSGLYFFAPSKAEPDVPLTAWTQGEPIANRHWFPCFDHPNEQQTTEVIATVPTGFEALSNGRLLSRQKVNENWVRFHWMQDKPHVSYLVTLAVGRFAVSREQWRGIPVLYYVPPDRAGDTKRTFGRTLEMLDFFSERFGIKYPWDQYAQVVVEQFVAGGMENTSATTLCSRVMHDERSMLDDSPDWLIAHELGHQWWGDLLTCKDWTHLWLNEGFGTYCEALWAEHKLGPDERDYLLYGKGKQARGASPKSRPIVDRYYPNPRSMFDARTYPKAAWVIHMLRRQLGDEQFFDCLKRYAETFRHRTVETTDFRLVFERQTGRSLGRFFFDWLERTGHPELEIVTTYSEKEKLCKVVVKQTQKEAAFHFPLRLEIDGGSGTEPKVIDQEVTEKELVFYVPVPKRPHAIRVDPQQSLLAEIKEQKARDWWQRQLLEAGSVAERIRAAEHFGESKSAADRELLAKALAEDRFYGVRVEVAAALGQSGGDSSRNVLVAGLRAEHPKVRRACAQALGKFAGDPLALNALEQHLSTGDASYFVEAAVIRSYAQVQQTPALQPLLAQLTKSSHGEVIRQAALDGLAGADDPQALKVLLEWTARGKPRSCRIAAMAATARYLRNHEVAAQTRSAAIETLMSRLVGEGPRVRRTAAEALRDLGRWARPAEQLLASLAEQDADQRVRDRAAEALQKIRADTPAPVEVGALREELKTLRKSSEEMEDRLLKLEGK